MESNITKILIKKFRKRCVTLPWIAHMRYGPPLWCSLSLMTLPSEAPALPPQEKTYLPLVIIIKDSIDVQSEVVRRPSLWNLKSSLASKNKSSKKESKLDRQLNQTRGRTGERYWYFSPTPPKFSHLLDCSPGDILTLFEWHLCGFQKEKGRGNCKVCHPGGGGYSIKFYTGRLRLEVQTITINILTVTKMVPLSYT